MMTNVMHACVCVCGGKYVRMCVLIRRTDCELIFEVYCHIVFLSDGEEQCKECSYIIFYGAFYVRAHCVPLM